MNLSEQALQLYQSISNKYDKNRHHPHRLYIVNPNMIHHWERIFTVEKERNETNRNFEKLMVLNLGCGSGNDTWVLYNQFESHIKSVIGVDLSNDMIQLANNSKEQVESSLSKKIPLEFIVGDVIKLNENEQLKKLYYKHSNKNETKQESPVFDFVTACHLLHYSSDYEELCKMCKSISGMLKPGGTFLTLNSNPFLNEAQINQDQKKLGVYRSNFMIDTKERNYLIDGDQFEISIDLNFNEFDQNENFIVKIQNRYFSPQSYEKALKLAGFSKVVFHKLRLDEKELGAKEYGRNSMDVCTAIVIEATKQAN